MFNLSTVKQLNQTTLELKSIIVICDVGKIGTI